MVKHDIEYTYIRPGKYERHFRWVVPPAIFVTAFVLYIKTMAPSIFWGNSAALALNNHILGVSQSPSSPLYVLLGRVINLLPNLSPAFSSNLLSAFFAALTVMVFYMIIKQLSDVPLLLGDYKKIPAYQKLVQNNPELLKSNKLPEMQTISRPILTALPSLSGTALFALTLPVWLSAIRAEVYSLHLALTMVALLCAIKGMKSYQPRFYYLGLWIYALSFANHPLLALAFAPAFAYFIIVDFINTKKRIETLSIIILLSILAGTVYLYLPVRSTLIPGPGWSYPESLGSFWASVVLPFKASATSGPVGVFEHWLHLKKISMFIAGQIGWPVIALLLLGLWGLFNISRKLFFFFPLAILCNIGVILWTGDFDPRNYESVNQLAPLIGLVIIVAIAGSLYFLRTKFLAGQSSVFITIFVACFAVTAAYDNMKLADMSDFNGPDIICEKILNKLQGNSLIIIGEEDLQKPLQYHTCIDSGLSHIKIISAENLADPNYRKYLKAHYPDLNYPTGFDSIQCDHSDSLPVELCRLNMSSQDVYIQYGLPGISSKQISPAGVLFKYNKKRHQTSKRDRNQYKQHLDMTRRIIDGNRLDERTIDITGRWLFKIGNYYEQIGKKKIARDIYNSALTIDMRNTDMRIYLANSLAVSGNYKEALKYISDALEIDPNNETVKKTGQQIINIIEKQKTIASGN